MSFEIIVTSLIVISAVYIFYKNIKKKSSGKCDCGSCSNHCTHYKKNP